MSGARSERLNCNSCWEPISGNTMIISMKCFHVFCPRCAEEWFHIHSYCSMCKQPVNKDIDVRGINLQVEVQEKAKNLFGLSPTKLCEILNSAMNFWDYQRRIHTNRIESQSRNDGVNMRMQEEMTEKLNSKSQQLMSMQDEFNRQQMRVQNMERELLDLRNQIDLQKRHNLSMNTYSDSRPSSSPVPSPRFMGNYHQDNSGMDSGDRSIVTYPRSMDNYSAPSYPHSSSSPRGVIPQGLQTPIRQFNKNTGIPSTPQGGGFFSAMNGSRPPSTDRTRSATKSRVNTLFNRQ